MIIRPAFCAGLWLLAGYKGTNAVPQAQRILWPILYNNCVSSLPRNHEEVLEWEWMLTSRPFMKK